MQIDNRRKVAYLRLDNYELFRLISAVKSLKGGIPFSQLDFDERITICDLLDIDFTRIGKYKLGIKGMLEGDL